MKTDNEKELEAEVMAAVDGLNSYKTWSPQMQRNINTLIRAAQEMRYWVQKYSDEVNTHAEVMRDNARLRGELAATKNMGEIEELRHQIKVKDWRIDADAKELAEIKLVLAEIGKNSKLISAETKKHAEIVNAIRDSEAPKENEHLNSLMGEKE